MGWKCTNAKCTVVVVQDNDHSCPGCGFSAPPQPKGGNGKGKGSRASQGRDNGGKSYGKGGKQANAKCNAKGKTRKGGGKGNYEARANDGGRLPFWGRKGAAGRAPNQHDAAKSPSMRTMGTEYQKLLAQNRKMQQQLQQMRGESTAPRLPRAHEVHVCFEGAQVSLISLTRMLEVEEQERGYKGHARYDEIKEAVQRCREVRDASVPPQIRLQKLDRVLEGLQKRKQTQQESWDKLQMQQDELDKLWQACKTEGEKADDEIREAKADWEKADAAAKATTNAWSGKGGQAKGASGAQCERDAEHHNLHQDDDEEYWGEPEQEGSCPLSEDVFVEWLQKRDPSMYETATDYFSWDPPTGMLDKQYAQYTREGANAKALRQVITARENGEDMQQWKEWTEKHLEFFIRQGIHTMPEDIQDAYGAGYFCQEASPKPQLGRNNWNKAGKTKEANGERATVRSRSPVPRAGGDAANDVSAEEPCTNGTNEALIKIRGPYLEPKLEGGKYTILSIQGQYEYSREMEMSRGEYQSTMAREVQSEAEMEAGGPKKKELLQAFLLAIHQKGGERKRFPKLDDYFDMVENKGPVAVETTDE